MANISKEYTYNLPDEYTKQTSDLGLTATATYSGPEFLYVFVDAETGKLQPAQSCMPVFSEDADAENAQIRAGLDERAILLRPNTDNTDAIIASIFFHTDTGKEAGYPQKSYTLDGETEPYYEHPDPQLPDHTYNVDEITYNFATGSWVEPFPFMEVWITMEQHVSARDGIVAGATDFLAAQRANLTAAQITEIEAFIAEMGEVYTKYDGVEAFMIPFPTDPTVGLLENYDYNEDPEGLLAE